MTRHLEIQPVAGPINSTIQPPGSKSLTNRAVLCAAMATGQSNLTGALDSDDTRVMIESLGRLGIAIEADRPAGRVIVSGCRGSWSNRNADLFVGNSGTTIRFLTAVLGVGGGRYRLDGIARMRERPIVDLCAALQQLGTGIRAESVGGCPPVVIDSEAIHGGKVVMRGDVSSQYLSGMMLAAPLARDGIEIRIDGPLVSKPYVRMTSAVMNRFGVECEVDESFIEIHVPGGQRYASAEYQIEPDASAASYFWAAAAICGGTLSVTGLNRDSVQGDIQFVDCLQQMGCDVNYGQESIAVTGPARRGIDIDMSDISDTVQTLSAVSLFVDGTTTIRGVGHNRVKETDRIGNLAAELRKLGADVEETADGLSITPHELQAAEIETYDDHRMAMSLALVGLKQHGVIIRDPECVSKTYPNYFEDLRSIAV